MLNLTRCAEDILLAREAHFPATIADLYDPEAMDTKYLDLRAAHDRNDTERLEKLFELYTEMAGNADVRVGSGAKRNKKKPTGTSAFPGRETKA